MRESTTPRRLMNARNAWQATPSSPNNRNKLRTTVEELKQLAHADLAETDSRYQLGGSPLEQLDNMSRYRAAQLKTQGHFQSEGECSIDGGEHSHD